MFFFDISRTLNPEIAVWPGDSPFESRTILDRTSGASVNLTTLKLSAHTGTHIDAPYHFTDEGATVEALALALYWGRAQVVTVRKEAGPLLPSDFARHDLRRAPRLLVRSAASDLAPTVFPDTFVYPSPALASFLGEIGIVLYGTDAPSMDEATSQTLPGHNSLLRNGIAILEGLDLSGVPDAVYDFVALPLKIAGGDGSPVRAALRSIQQD